MPSFLQSILQSRVALVATAVVIVAIIAVAVFLVANARSAPAEEDVSKLPVSGISDTTGMADSDTGTGLVEVAPTSARVALNVKQGEECYLETYAGSVTTPYSLTGPAQENIEVTDKLIIATWTPEYVKVTVDGSEVTLTSNDKYGGMYTYTVDFPAILEQWRSTHTSREAQRSAALATAESSSTQGSASASASGQTTDATSQEQTQARDDEDEEEKLLEDEEREDEEQEEDEESQDEEE